MDLLILFGPAASGKMSVGCRIAERTRYRLFHNHMTIEPLLAADGQSASRSPPTST